MRFAFVALMLFLGCVAGPAQAAYPNNPIQWRPKDDAVASSPVWGYDANGDIACPTQDGVHCITSRNLAEARRAAGALSCGDQMRSLSGVSGYDSAGHWCRELALRHGNRDGFKWRAPSDGVPFYWRLNPATGNVECASDGTHCYWWAPSLENAFKRTTVVPCQAAEYGRAGHWCASLASHRRNNGYEWKLHQTIHYGRTPDRAVDDSYYSYSATGDIQCPSDDGITCFWPRTRAEAEAATQPIACGAEHEAKFGYNGYDTTGHWCRRFALAEGNAQGFAYQWGLFGLIDDGSGTPTVMCASEDGRHCYWDQSLGASFKATAPLVCGTDHALQYGDGVDTQDQHWCQLFAGPGLRGARVGIRNASAHPARICRAVPFEGEDRISRFADIRCTDLAAGSVESPSLVAVTTLPFSQPDQDAGFLYHAMCVEIPGAAALFAGPTDTDEVAGISIDPTDITQVNMIDLTGDSTTCRQAFATLSQID